MPVFNNLVRFDVTKAELSRNNIVPDLAERWEASKDGLSYTFFLVKGVKWHDGKPFTADDVIYSIEKMVDPKRSTLKDNFPAFKSAEKIDDYTVRLSLSWPQMSFFPQLASPYSAIYAKHTANVDAKSTDFLMGTGPYKFKNRTSGVDFEFEKNPAYFKKGLPYLDGMKFIIIPSPSAQVDAFVADRVDMTSQSTGITAQDAMNRYKTQAPNDTYQMVNYDGGQMWFFNLDYAPLKDVRVRKAIVLATDVDTAMIAGFGSSEFRNANVAFMPRDYGIGKTEIFKLTGWDQPLDTRFAEARKLMSAAGYEKGFKYKIVVPNLPTMASMTQALADLYKRQLNLDVEIALLPFAELQKAMISRDFHSIGYGINVVVGDPDEVASNFKTGTGQNISHYSNAEVDRLFDEQSRILDINQRKTVAQRIERQLLADLPGIPRGGMSAAVGMKSYVKDYVVIPSLYSSHLQMEKVWMNR
jgi:peptide/nickel transport system substrate-binding protein